MKKYIIFSLLVAATFGVGCKKNDGPLTDKGIVLEAVPIPNILKDGGSATINFANLASFQGRFTIKTQFPAETQPAKVDVVVRKNNNNGNIKVFQAGITTLPSTLTITAAQIATLFGTPITLGDNYDIGMDIYTASGKKYEEFPAAGGVAYGGTGQANLPGFSDFIRYSAACQYDAALFPTGNYIVLQDDWADYGVGDVVVLTQIDATHISFKYVANSPLPIIITIDPVSNATSATKQQYGDYGPPYGNWFAESVASTDNVVLPCAREIGIRLLHTSSGGYTGGSNTIRFRKQ